MPEEQNIQNPSPGDFRDYYLQQLGNYPLLGAEEELLLAREIKNGDEIARQKMIQSNLRLVVKIVQKYRDLGVPAADLISEGNIGLIRAIDRFDPEKGFRLSTYASWWIKQSVMDALSRQGRTIRLPSQILDQLREMRKIGMELTEELGREPSDEEIAGIWGQSSEKVRSLKKASLGVVSLETTVGGDENTSLGEMVRDKNTAGPEEKLRSKAVKEDLGIMLQQLDARELEVLRLRFGLDGEEPKTLEEIGEILNISDVRARQFQLRALSKIRKSLKGTKESAITEELKKDQFDTQSFKDLQEFIISKKKKKRRQKRSSETPIELENYPDI